MLHPVEVENVLRFTAEIGQLRDGGLHPESHFVLADTRLDFRVNPFFLEEAVKSFDFLDNLPLRTLTNPFGIADVMDSFAFGLKEYPLEFARQETAGPLARRNRLKPGFPCGGEHYKAGQFFGFRSNAIK